MTTADDLVRLTIDGRDVEVPKNTLLWEAAKSVDIDIPIFCYHSKLGPVGVCRMCLVEIEKQPKLNTACTTAVADGMVVYTKSPQVEKAQRGVLEFLLINHPLDCPICDRGGECPLQDQTFTYGPGVSRFIERKRHYLKPIRLGPTIDLDRERCILCWRCVRFTTEVAGDNQLILNERGSESFIDTYEGHPYVSNFSGNVVELCPVGALTSHKQRFTFRPWELKEHASICPNCAMGCNIQIDVRDSQEVIRFRSRANEDVDDGWLCDRGRFGYDFIGSRTRLTTPLVRRDGKLVPSSWSAAYRLIAENLQRVAAEKGPNAIAGIASGRLPNEDLFTFKRFIREVVGSDLTDFWPRPQMTVGGDQAAAMERLAARVTPISSLDKANLIVILGANPLEREPVMELRIRKAVDKLGVTLVEIGFEETELSSLASASVRCAPDQLSGMLWALHMADVPEGASEFKAVREVLGAATGQVVVIYDDAFPGMTNDAAADALKAIDHTVEWLAGRSSAGVIPMLSSCNEMGARDFGLASPGHEGGGWREPVTDLIRRGEVAAAILAGADPATSPGMTEALEKLEFLVVSELEMTETARRADVVLPAASFAERVGTFTNTSRRVQAFNPAVPTPGISRPDWQILVELSQRWDQPLNYSSPEQILADIRSNVALYADLIPDTYAKLEPSGRQPAPGSGVAAE